MTVIAAAVNGNIMAMAGDRGVTQDGVMRRLVSPKVQQQGAYLIGYYGSMEGDRLQRLLTFPNPPHPFGEDDYLDYLLDEFMHTDLLKTLQKFYSKQKFDTLDRENGLGLLIAVHGKIYSHDICDGSMTQYAEPYVAVGAGSQLALGALDVLCAAVDNPETAVQVAVATACKYSIYCSEPVDVVSLEIC